MNNSSDSDSSGDSNYEVDDKVPEEILKAANEVCLNLLPDVSRKRYIQVYDLFKEWCKSKNLAVYTEEVFLAYFAELRNSLAPPSLWSRFSMLKATMEVNENVDIGTYKKLLVYLKKLSNRHKSKKAKIFTAMEVRKFINEAPDDDYLAVKVALILGIMGACRREELTYLTTENVQDFESFLLITIPKSKTGIERSFTVTGEFYGSCKKYIDERPKESAKTNRFFLFYRRGVYVTQPIGINTIGSMPSVIARFLNLQDVDRYTSHSFRRTSATLLVDAGADITVLKRHGGWKSNSVAEGYIENSINNKRKIGQKIEESVTGHSSKQMDDSQKQNNASTSSAASTDSAKRQKLEDNIGTSHPYNENNFFRDESIGINIDGNSMSFNTPESNRNINLKFENCSVTININNK